MTNLLSGQLAFQLGRAVYPHSTALGRPFALIGVNINCHDPRKLKEVMDKELLNFRSFTDTANGDGLGVISSAWNLEGTPTLFVVDPKGVIRYRRLGIPDE